MDLKPDHPSYGLIKVERVRGSKPCFLSPYDGEGYVRLTLSQAVYNLDGDYATLGSKLVVIRMTWEQYLRLIGNPDCEQGSPCTIAYMQGNSIKLQPTPDKKEALLNDFQKHVNRIQTNSADLESFLEGLLTKGRASKGDLEKLSNKLSTVLNKVNTDLKYTVQLHQELIWQALENAKISLMAFASRLTK